jgi:hypothetical protein
MISLHALCTPRLPIPLYCHEYVFLPYSQKIGFFGANLDEVHHPQSWRATWGCFGIFPFFHGASNMCANFFPSKFICSSCAQPSPWFKGKKPHPNPTSLVKDIGQCIFYTKFLQVFDTKKITIFLFCYFLKLHVDWKEVMHNLEFDM